MRSLTDLEIHFQAHILRVARLGREILALSPEFRDVDPALLDQFLALHDQAKVNLSDPFIRQYGINRRNAPLLALSQIYGKQIENLTNEERMLAERVRDEVNRVDRAVAMNFFRQQGMLTSAGEPGDMALKFLRVEKIADSVDRAMSPVSAEEFHKVMDPARRWLRDEADKKIARRLERSYFALSDGLTFEEIRGRSLGAYPRPVRECAWGFAAL
ncbi:MAG: hypothetical protein HUU37_11435 [Bdellovibrionales bacterium]|nr:hypothetical protein [Bdellovibrionales bacterium]